MSGYGFRLYVVKLVTGAQKSKAVDFGKAGMNQDQHAGVWVRRALDLLESYEPLTGPPILHHAIDEEALQDISTYVRTPNRGEYRIKFVEHTPTPSTRIRFKLQYGRTGKVSVGVQDGGAIPLGHIPTGDIYRGILYLPPVGSKGLLALESVPSAPNPARMLNNWFARAAVDLAIEDQASIAGDENTKARPMPFKLNFAQYPNLERIEKAVKNSPAAKVVLRKEAHDGAGTPSGEDVILSSTLGEATKRNTAAKLAGNMVRKATGKLEDGEDPVSLADLENLVEGSLTGIEWSEGYIQIDDATGLKKIGLETIDKYFVYPLSSNTQLSDSSFEKAVAKEVVDLQSNLGLDLDLA